MFTEPANSSPAIGFTIESLAKMISKSFTCVLSVSIPIFCSLTKKESASFLQDVAKIAMVLRANIVFFIFIFVGV